MFQRICLCKHKMISGKEENIATLQNALIQFVYFDHSALAMSALAKIFHLVAVAHFYFGAYYDITYVTGPDSKHRGFGYAGRYIYLTILSFVSFTVVFNFITNLYFENNFQGHEQIVCF